MKVQLFLGRFPLVYNFKASSPNSGGAKNGPTQFGSGQTPFDLLECATKRTKTTSAPGWRRPIKEALIMRAPVGERSGEMGGTQKKTGTVCSPRASRCHEWRVRREPNEYHDTNEPMKATQG